MKHSIPVLPFLRRSAAAAPRAAVALLAPVLALCALALPARAQQALTIPRPDPAVAEFARGVKFTVAGYTGTEVLTNFPVLVRLSESAIDGFLYSDFNYTDGTDLCFIDMETNGIPYEIDTWNRSGESLVWVTLPRVTNGTEFVMWYHSVASGANTVSTGDPWREYTGVWHMNDTANTGVLLKDSTTNGLGASVTSGSFAQSNGRIGGSRIPTKTGTSKDSQCIEVSLSETTKRTAVDNLNTAANGNEFSVALWVKPEKYSSGKTDPQSAYLVGRKVADADPCWAIQYHYQDPGDKKSHYNQFRLWASETTDQKVKVFTVDTSVIPDSQAANGNWYKLYAVYNGRNLAFYVNGTAYVGTATADAAAANGNNSLFLAGTSGTGTRDFRGEMDEVRLRSGVSSADWVKADYDTVANAAFLSAGSVESVAIVEKPVFGVTLDDFGASHAQFTATVSSLGALTASSCILKAKVWPTAGTEPAAWTEYASHLEQDVPATFKVKGLSTATPYSYKILVENDENVEANETVGSFTTAGVGVAGTGGDVTRVGDDWIHYFRVGIDDESGDTVNTYTFAPPSYASTVRALVVAGGGPGGYQAGGGGGAGGYVYDAALAVSSASAYTVNVGAGGIASTSHDAYGSNGGDSSIVGGSVNVVAVGGGAGGNGNTHRPGASGGSGGGSSLKAEAVGAGTSGQGQAGGLGNDQTTLANRLAGGGGGAGAAGGNATLTGATLNPGGGGKGTECDITGAATWYAGGGGGGGGFFSGKQDAAAGGGLGGGGAGSRKPASGSVELAGDGVDGLGGGGGGGSGDQSGYEKGGDGGDGIVIIRYASQGDPSLIPEPIISLQSAVYDDADEACDVSFRVAWGGYNAQTGTGYEDADVAIVWGIHHDNFSHTNSIATDAIGLGTGTFPLAEQTRTVYMRALATNDGGHGALSTEIIRIPFVNQNAPVATVSATPGITTAGFEANVTSLGGAGATWVEGVFQVCDDEYFEDGTYLTFPVTNGTLSAAGVLKGGATGLAAHKHYWVRAVLTNDIPAVLETDPVEFHTNPFGLPNGQIQPSDDNPSFSVGATSISATFNFTGLGEGATSGSAWMEVSATSDFATILASSAVTNVMAADIPATFDLTVEGLEPATAYYVRYRVRNNGGRETSNEKTFGPCTTPAASTTVTLTVPSPLPENVTLVSVTTNGVAVAGNASVYTVFSNDTVTVTFAAAEGYRLAGDATVTVVMDANKTLAGIPTAELIPSPTATATLTIPEPPANVTLVSVTTNDVEVAAIEGAYTVFSNATATVTFAPAAGYRLVGSATVTVVVDGDKTLATADMPTAEALPPPTVTQSATKVSARKTVTLTAFAEGATSYYWLKNGVVIEGGANGTLTVVWRRPENHPIDTYQAVAVYDIDGLPVESQPSTAMTVENRPMPTVIMVKGEEPPAPPPPAPHDYSADYLTFRVLTSGTISWKSFGSVARTIEYSIDNGVWTSLTSMSEGATISVAQGNLVRFRGSNDTYATSKDAYSGFEGGTATYDIEGNIMSLLYGDNFAESTTFQGKSYIFCSLFKKAPVVSAEHLILPATTLKEYCYRALFSWCTTLTKAPELPATTLAKGCYWYMFEQCAITEAPVLNATTLVAECYGHMFTDCGLLNSITCLATSGFNTSNCLTEWVKNVAGDGVFVKAANVTSWTTGVSGIPTGWIVCEDVLLLPPEVSFYGDTIELECPTEGAEIHYRLGQTGVFALYTGPVSIIADTVLEAYSTYQGHTSQTVTQNCAYVHETPFQRSNKDLTTWRYGGNTITTPYSVNGIDGHSSSYSKGTFAFDTSITLREKQPTYLWFQHADQSADIYVDGVKVGTHWGGYNAFFFDISDYVHRGKNDIRVALCNNRGSSLAPAAGDFNFNATLGNVKLFTSPCLPAMKYGYDGFHITSTVTSSSATVNVRTTVPSGATLVCTITDDDGYEWTDTKTSNGEEQTFTTTITGDDLHLWNGTIDPYLYTVTLEIKKDGELYHRYERPYGFRYYEYVVNQPVQGENYTGFLLNGRPYQLRGVCMHDDVEGKANALTDSDYDQEFAIIRELGCNFIRLAHYPHPKEVYDRCDRLGIVVQTEVPCVNKLQSTMPGDYYTHLETQYTDMVEQHFNHPCILFWGLSNETVTDDKAFGKEKIEGYYALIKELDSERMVGYVMSHSYDNPSAAYNDPDVDWFGCNLYVGWYIDKTSNNPSPRLNTRIANTTTRRGKPLALSEYGCGGTQHCHSEDFRNTTTSGNNPRHDIEYQMWLHEGHIAAIRNYPQLLFTSQWQLFDIAVSSRREGYTECLDGENATTNDDLKYLNNKGLVERDHVTKKDTFYLYKAEWNPDPFVHICGKDYTKTTGRVLKCYTNDGDTLSLYVGDNWIEDMPVVNHIAEFTARDFPAGVEIRVEGENTSDTVTFQ